jgi:glutaredoxin
MRHLRKISTVKIITVVIITITIAACKSQKGLSTAAPVPAPAVTSTAPASNYLFIKPDGIRVPGNKELTALQAQYKAITLDQLKQGYAIYTAFACTHCHDAKNIYDLETAKWRSILDDMAQKANISDAEKDAVYKYVLSIKATQAK